MDTAAPTPRIPNDFYADLHDGRLEYFDLGDFDLAEGGAIPDAKLAYVTHGKLNDAKDNAILVPTWYSGTSQIMEEVYVGPEHALDPSEYFVIIVNQLGNGVSSSPHNTAGEAGMGGFPHVRVGDDVRAQQRLVSERFGIDRLALVVGGSMGAQQTYEWIVRFPDQVARAAPIAGTAQNTEHDFIFTKTLIDALTSDPGWNGGNYERAEDVGSGVRRHAEIWSVMGWSTEFYKQKRYQDLGFDTPAAFLDGFMYDYFIQRDPNALLAMAWKWQRGDVARNTGGDLEEALARVTAKTFVMPIDEDMFFPPRDCKAEQAMIPNSEYRECHTIDGHLGLFGTDPDFVRQVDEHLSALLALPDEK